MGYTFDFEGDFEENRSLDAKAEVDAGLAKLREAAGDLSEHKAGKGYQTKAIAYIRHAMPLASLIRRDEAARAHFENLAEWNKVKVRGDAKHPDIKRLFLLAQKKMRNATCAVERNKWATLINYGLTKGLSADELLGKVQALRGITRAAAAFRALEDAEAEVERNDDAREGADAKPEKYVSLVLTVYGLGDDVVLEGQVPAPVATAVCKQISASLGGGT